MNQTTTGDTAMHNTITFDTISANRLNVLKTLLKSYYMGEFMPPVDLIQGYYDFKLDPNKPFYQPGEIVSCTVTEHISGCLKTHELAAHIKYANSKCCSVIEYWHLEDINKWID
jgi:hypothetical protein